MSIDVNWNNPYADCRGNWYKGNLHTHTSPASECGKVPSERVLELYNEKGYDFLSISDHMNLYEVEKSPLCLIPGIEWNSPEGEHTGGYSCDQKIMKAAIHINKHNELLDYLLDKNALIVLNHPDWQSIPHYRREVLEQKRLYDGIEIYNGVIERMQGEAVSTGKWDYLLGKGRRLLGFANDDSHLESDIGRAWLQVRALELNVDSIMTALKNGNFYCSTGVVISDIRKKGNSIEIKSENAEEIHVTGTGGKILQRKLDCSICFDISTIEKVDFPYVRFTFYGYGASMAWTQPFFLDLC